MGSSFYPEIVQCTVQYIVDFVTLCKVLYRHKKTGGLGKDTKGHGSKKGKLFYKKVDTTLLKGQGTVKATGHCKSDNALQKGHDIFKGTRTNMEKDFKGHGTIYTTVYKRDKTEMHASGTVVQYISEYQRIYICISY